MKDLKPNKQKINLRRHFALSAAILIISSPNFAPSAHADCTENTEGDTLTCSGDVTDIPFISTETISEIIFNGTTTEFGNRGFRFINSEAVDVTFDTTNEPIIINLMPPVTNVDGQRTGFHVYTEGRIDGVFAGSLSGAVERDRTSNNDDRIVANYGALGLDAGTGIDFTLNGNIDVTRGVITQTDTSRQDLWTGRFAALRAESDAGDIAVTSTGNISIEGGRRIVDVNNLNDGTAGARAVQFRNGFSETHGVIAQGFGRFDFTHEGNISVTGGGGDVSATTGNNTAEAEIASSVQGGIYVPSFNSIDGEFVEGLPRFETVDIDYTGNINVSGGEISVSANSDSMAIAVSEDFLVDGNAFGISISADNIDLDLVGDVTVEGGDTSAIANAGAGLVHVDARVQDAEGISVVNGVDGRNHLSVTGLVTAIGGDAFGEATGTGPAETGTLYSDVRDQQQFLGLFVGGGRASGISYLTGGDDTDLTVTQAPVVRGGNGHGIAHGSGYRANVFGGGALPLNIFAFDDAAVDYTQSLNLEAYGGDAHLQITGEDILGRVQAGGALGFDLASGGVVNLILEGDLNAYGGDTTYDFAAGNAEGSSALGGSAQGVNLSLIGTNTRSTVTINGDITARGGNVSGSGEVESISGGFAEGIRLFTGNGEVTTLNINSNIRAIAGAGRDGSSAFGLFALGPATINLNGNISAEGGGAGDNIFGSNSSIGIFASDDSSPFRDTPGINIEINGGEVNSEGENAFGVLVAAETFNLNVLNGGQVIARGDTTQGVAVGAQVRNDNAISTNATIVVDETSSIISENGVAIIDVSEVTQTTVSSEGTTTETFPVENSTTVDVAGTLTSGTGVAVDLRSGEDNFIGRSSAVINGDVLLGEGDDLVTTEDGVTINGVLDAGAGNDTLTLSDGTNATSISLGEGDDVLLLTELRNTLELSGGDGNDTAQFITQLADDLSFDLGNFALLDFETFAQEGSGQLTITGNSADIFSHYELRGGSLRQTIDLETVSMMTSAGTSLQLGGSLASLDVGGEISTLGDPTAQVDVVGDIIFRSGSLYNARFLPDGTSDRISAGGEVTIEGGMVNAMSAAGRYIGGDQFTILSGEGGVTGTFDGLTEASTAFLDITLEYIGNDVVIQLAPSADFIEVADTANQLGAATGLFAFPTMQGTDERVVVSELSFLMENEALPALDATSGELHASILKAGMVQARTLPMAMKQRTHIRRDRAGFSAWVGGSGLTGDIDADNNASKTDFDQTALVGGVDWNDRSGKWQLGAAIGVSNDTLHTDRRLSKAIRNATHFGGYGHYGTSKNGLNVTTSLAVSKGEADTVRRIQFGNLDRTARAAYDIDLVNAQAELRYGIGNNGQNWSYGPALRLDHTSVDQGRINESGAASLNLSGAQQKETQTDIALGGFVNWESENVQFDASAMYDVSGSDSVGRTLNFEGAPTTDFTVFSPETGSGILIDSTLEWKVKDRISLGLGYEGRYSENQQSHAGLVRVSLQLTP